MKNIIIHIFLLLPISVFSQDVSVDAIMNGNEIVLQAVNNTNFGYEVEVTLITSGYGLKRKESVKKEIPKRQTIILGKYTLKADKSKKRRTPKFEYEYTLKKLIEIEIDTESIIMYSKKGCHRCIKTREYFTAKNIVFTEHDITNRGKYFDQLSQLLFAYGFKGGAFSTPVISIKDELYYDIKDLDAFLKKI